MAYPIGGSLDMLLQNQGAQSMSSPQDEIRQLLEAIMGQQPQAAPPPPTRGAKAKDALGTMLAGLADAVGTKASVLGRFNAQPDALRQLQARREMRRREQVSSQEAERERYSKGKSEAAKELLSIKRDEGRYEAKMSELERRLSEREARYAADREARAAEKEADRLSRQTEEEQNRQLRREIESMRAETRKTEESGRMERAKPKAETAAADKVAERQSVAARQKKMEKFRSLSTDYKKAAEFMISKGKEINPEQIVEEFSDQLKDAGLSDDDSRELYNYFIERLGPLFSAANERRVAP